MRFICGSGPLYKNLHNFTFCVKRWHGVSIREQ